jgi:radical S-adenosyl methionine domain-containing protein 2
MDNIIIAQKPMVVNLHLLDDCNYRCLHCFAHFKADRILSLEDWKAIIDNIVRDTPVCRFNLAGGEPLLYPSLQELIQYINNLGIKISIITNGFCLTKEMLRSFRRKVSMIGLSIDSLDSDTLRKIGRCTVSKQTLYRKACTALCKNIKKAGIRLKINTVISANNRDEDFSRFINDVRPDRWKIIKMKPYESSFFSNMNIMPDDSDYENFIHRHRFFSHVAERNMKNAYIMVDAFGNLVDTGSRDNSPIVSLLREDFRSGFESMKFDIGTYNSRYL